MEQIVDLLPGEFPFRPMRAVAIGLVTVLRPIVHLITTVATHRFVKNVLMDTLRQRCPPVESDPGLPSNPSRLMP